MAAYGDDLLDDWDEDPDCTLCAGEGYTECPDPIQCMDTHDLLGLCACGGCGGSGLSKDQRIW